MNCRLKKEFRPLLLPWMVGVGSIAAACVLGQLAGAGEFRSFLLNTSSLVFPGALALLAALSFGAEIQQHTLVLLLSQPADRTRIWAEKTLVVAVCVGSAALTAAGLLFLLSLGSSGDQFGLLLTNTNETVLFGVFLLATVCSCGFWTLVARSSIGGSVFTIAAQFLIGASVVGIIAWRRGPIYDESHAFPALVVLGMVYSALFLWLSWRKFVRLEVRSAGLNQTASPSLVINPKLPWATLFVCRPREKVRNLIRKELRLEKPVFLLAALFMICWGATALVQWLRPGQKIAYVFDILTCVYAPVAALLAGCVPLGEEKALDMAAAQLTLPVSQMLQWLSKLGVGVVTVAGLCLALPFCLFHATAMVFDLSTSGILNPNDHGLDALAVVCGLAFLSGYWAVSMMSHAVKAALVAVSGLVLLGACAALGTWLAQQSNGWQTAPLVSLMCHFQLPPELMRETANRASSAIWWLLVGTLLLLSLWQSLVQFKRSAQKSHPLLSYSCVLGTLTCLLAFWSVDFISAVNRLAYSAPVRELQSTMNLLVARGNTNSIEPQTVPFSQLEQTIRFSELTRVWVRNSRLTYSIVPSVNLRNGDTDFAWTASILFPNSRQFDFYGPYFRAPHVLKPNR